MSQFPPTDESPEYQVPPFFELGGRHSQVLLAQPRQRPYWLHAVLFVLTVGTTLIVGSKLQFNYQHGLPMFASTADYFPLRWVFEQPSRLWLGFPFCATLLGILLAHEMGHFYFCVKNRVYATLPFFLPAPTLIGTLGAFIRIRSPIGSRDALFDIGVAGPIAGFVVALPLLFLSLAISKPPLQPSGESLVEVSYPLIFAALEWLIRVLHPGGPSGLATAGGYSHPMVLACWVGMFATCLNLLPSGQLDGGHIVYALWPKAHGNVSRATIFVLLPIGLYFWPGWLVWAVLLLITRMRHPQVPVYPVLSPARRSVAVFALFMLILTFTPEPFLGSSLREMWSSQ